ncbi:MAG: hypothetical protein L7U70_03400, partial [Flavobacteriales bacterium]|nr:hypothetical protein [Flavobacteriales bacterium]
MRKIFHFFCCMVLFMATSQLSATTFDVVNTGSNMTVFVTPGSTMTGDVSQVDQLGIFYTNDADETVCAGVSTFDASGGFQLTLWGSEPGEDNGMADGEALTWKAVADGGAMYDVTAGYDNGPGVYTLNNVLYVTSLNFDLVQATASEGCVDENA